MLGPVVAAGVAGTVLLTVATVAIAENRRTVQAQAAVRVTADADAVARALTRQSDDFARTAEAGANDDEVGAALVRPGPGTRAQLLHVLTILSVGKAAPVAFVTDLRGRVVATYPSEDRLEGRTFSYRDWFKGVSRGDVPYVSSAYRTAATGHPLVVGVASPVLVRGRRVGYLVLTWQLESVRSTADGARRDDGVDVTVTDQRGQPLTGAFASDDRGQPYHVAVPAMTRSALTGRRVSDAGGGRLTTAVPVPGLGWTVSATLATRAALEPATDFRRLLLLVVCSAFLLLAGGLGLTLRSIQRRIDAQAMADQRQRDLRTAQAAVRVSDLRFRRVFDEGYAGKALSDESGTILHANAALGAVLGLDPARLLNRPLTSFLASPEDQQRVAGEVLARGQDLSGEMAPHTFGTDPCWGRVVMSWMSEDDGRRLLLTQVEDITGRRVAEQRLSRLALHDELTGLPNRRLLIERCEPSFAIARSGRAGTSVSMFFVDLDGFKTVNDRAGHAVGDQLLVAVAADLVRVLRPGDTVARIGGDEFVVLLGQDDGLAFVRMVAERVGTTVRRQLVVEGSSVDVSASVGIARVDLVQEPDVQPEQLIRRADAAMYSAKERGRDRQEVYDGDVRARTEGRQALERAVRDGLRGDRIRLVYQPVVDIDSGHVVGAEALMRLTGSDGRLVPTLPAIVAAEQAGLAELVGDRVQDLALQALSGWPSHLTVAVNVSAYELTGTDFRDRVERALRRHQIDPCRLVLEITESSMLRSGATALRSLARLRSWGCGSPSTTSARPTRLCGTSWSCPSTSSRWTPRSPPG
jgi:diguanylate cyclase (GGDEF)-like protein/PAS domain S-box-containing protein